MRIDFKRIISGRRTRIQHPGKITVLKYLIKGNLNVSLINDHIKLDEQQSHLTGEQKNAAELTVYCPAVEQTQLDQMTQNHKMNREHRVKGPRCLCRKQEHQQHLKS